MSKSGYTHHAHDRALERYGLDLTHADFSNIRAACQDGRAPKLRADDRGAVHLFTYMGKTLVVLLEPEGERIISFLPPEYFQAGNKLRHRTKTRHGKTVPAVANNALPRHERRITDRSIIEDSMEGGEE